MYSYYSLRGVGLLRIRIWSLLSRRDKSSSHCVHGHGQLKGWGSGQGLGFPWPVPEVIGATHELERTKHQGLHTVFEFGYKKQVPGLTSSALKPAQASKSGSPFFLHFWEAAVPAGPCSLFCKALTECGFNTTNTLEGTSQQAIIGNNSASNTGGFS